MGHQLRQIVVVLLLQGAYLLDFFLEVAIEVALEVAIVVVDSFPIRYRFLLDLVSAQFEIGGLL